MARMKRKMVEGPSEFYWSIQLTPEQKAAARAEMEKLAADAARKGVYRKLLALRGKVHLSYDIDALREDRD